MMGQSIRVAVLNCKQYRKDTRGKNAFGINIEQ